MTEYFFFGFLSVIVMLLVFDSTPFKKTYYVSEVEYLDLDIRNYEEVRARSASEACTLYNLRKHPDMGILEYKEVELYGSSSDRDYILERCSYRVMRKASGSGHVMYFERKY